MSEEVVLHGGLTNAGRVTRVADTVRRPPSSPATWALLEHLERAGFDGAPRFLGVDDQGREILSYLPGRAAIEPHQAWALSDEALVSVADLLRRFHQAVASFDPSGHAWPDFVPTAFRDGIVSHNDPNLDNVIFSGGVAVGLIDFDLAGPGSAVWDVTCAARLWAPLRDELDLPEELRGRSLERMRLFVDAYGLPRERSPAGGRGGGPHARPLLPRRARGGRQRPRAVRPDVARGRRGASRAHPALARRARSPDAGGAGLTLRPVVLLVGALEGQRATRRDAASPPRRPPRSATSRPASPESSFAGDPRDQLPLLRRHQARMTRTPVRSDSVLSAFAAA